MATARKDPAPSPTTEGEIVARDDTTALVIRKATPQEILAFVRGEHVQTDPTETRLALAMQKFQATSLEALVARRKPVMSRDYLNQPFSPTSPDGFRWFKSTFDVESEPESAAPQAFWAAFDAVDANGETILLGTSSGDAMLSFYVAADNWRKAKELGSERDMREWDVSARHWQFVKADKPTERGFYPVFLELITG